MLIRDPQRRLLEWTAGEVWTCVGWQSKQNNESFDGSWLEWGQSRSKPGTENLDSHKHVDGMCTVNCINCIPQCSFLVWDYFNRTQFVVGRFFRFLCRRVGASLLLPLAFVIGLFLKTDRLPARNIFFDDRWLWGLTMTMMNHPVKLRTRSNQRQCSCVFNNIGVNNLLSNVVLTFSSFIF